MFLIENAYRQGDKGKNSKTKPKQNVATEILFFSRTYLCRVSYKFVAIAELYLATLGHTLDDSAEKDVDNSGDVLTLGVKFFRPATTKDKRKKLKDQFPA